MADTEESFMTPRHLSAFGAIVHIFARHELLIVGGRSHLTNCDGGLLMHLTAEVPYRAKKDAFIALLRSGAPAEQVTRISEFLGEIHKYNNIRNAIAHNGWKPGTRPGSIKPLSLGVRGGTTSILGISDDEPEYTEDDLKAVVDDLFKFYDRFRRYLFEIGFLPMRGGHDRSE